jgi:hypothetical protein
LIVEKLLKLVGLRQQMQILSLKMKEMHDCPMIKPSMVYVKHFHRLNLLKKISNYGTVQEAWQILETTYEGTKLVKSAKLQMLFSIFKEIKMMDNETFGEFYSKMRDLRSSMVSLGKTVSDVKLIRKILNLCLRVSESR